jgi:hypothetical protein
VTLVERKTGYTLIGKLPDRSKHELTARAAWLIHKHTDRFQTITADNGTEFHDYKRIEEQTGVCFYFANPHHSWERGTNENTNGLIRQYLPSDLSAVLDGAPPTKREQNMARYDILLQLLTQETTAIEMANEKGDAWTVGFLGSALQDVADLVGRELLVRIVDSRNEASKLDPLNAPSNARSKRRWPITFELAQEPRAGVRLTELLGRCPRPVLLKL